MPGLAAANLQNLDLHIDSQSQGSSPENLDISIDIGEISNEQNPFGNLISKQKQKVILSQFEQMEAILIDATQKEEKKEQTL